jgi:hypothetical protein
MGPITKENKRNRDEKKNNKKKQAKKYAHPEISRKVRRRR